LRFAASRQRWKSPRTPSRWLESWLDEYNTIVGSTPPNHDPSRLGEVRRRGRDLGKALAGDEPRPARVQARPIYHTPKENMQAAAVLATQLDDLSGKALRRQYALIGQLLESATQQ
jgi:hypothetical protein